MSNEPDMSPTQEPESGHHETKPEDRVPFGQKLVYGSGALVNNLLAVAMGNMMALLNLVWGMNPALVGALGGLPRIVDAITDPLMGHISDNTRTRWGRRRPYIFVGAILVGIVYAVLWQLPKDQTEDFYFNWFLIGSVIFFIAYTIFATPWVALGFELTPDYHERTRLMGVQFFIGQFPYIIAPWFVAITTWAIFTDQAQGASVLAIIVCVVSIAFGVLPALLLKERPLPPKAPSAEGESAGVGGAVVGFFKAFLQTLASGPFLLLCAATFLVFNGFQLIASFQLYVTIYFVAGGDQAVGGEWFGWAGSVQNGSTFFVIPFVTWLAGKIGKRRAFYVSTTLAIVGYLMKWFCYDPNNPWLVIVPAPFMAFALGGLFTLMPSMIADVVDLDELKTNERREGLFGAVFWWVVKLGMGVAVWGGGLLLNYTGFDVELGGNQSAEAIHLMRVFDVVVPAATAGLAIFAMSYFPLTEQKAFEVRAELEARRGTAQPKDEDDPSTF